MDNNLFYNAGDSSCSDDGMVRHGYHAGGWNGVCAYAAAEDHVRTGGRICTRNGFS